MTLESPTFSLPKGEATPLALPEKKRRGRSRKDKAVAKSITNPSGIHPTEFKVVILPDEAEDTITFANGHKLYKPTDTVDKEKHASQSGTIIAVSPLAFRYEIWPEGSEPPQVGQKALFAKYAGIAREGKDGKEYRIMNDKDLVAVLDE